jgi:hypothetical protein
MEITLLWTRKWWTFLSVLKWLSAHCHVSPYRDHQQLSRNSPSYPHATLSDASKRNEPPNRPWPYSVDAAFPSTLASDRASVYDDRRALERNKSPLPADQTDYHPSTRRRRDNRRASSYRSPCHTHDDSRRRARGRITVCLPWPGRFERHEDQSIRLARL